MTHFNDQYVMTIDGKSVGADSTFEAYNPATKETIAKVPDASQEQLDEAVTSARNAFQSWSTAPLSQRQAAEFAQRATQMA
jgi:acyl-CoA reductase-like NAD-dependent aldehyde dehydrogenase